MPVDYHPPQGSIVTVNYFPGFKAPEMVKRRLAVVLSPAMKARPGLCTVVPLSTKPPFKVAPFHCELDVAFKLPKKWGNITRWVKGDMIYAVGFHRIDLLRLGKDKNGERIYQLETLPEADFRMIQRCVLHGLGLSTLTKAHK